MTATQIVPLSQKASPPTFWVCSQPCKQMPTCREKNRRPEGEIWTQDSQSSLLTVAPLDRATDFRNLCSTITCDGNLLAAVYSEPNDATLKLVCLQPWPWIYLDPPWPWIYLDPAPTMLDQQKHADNSSFTVSVVHAVSWPRENHLLKNIKGPGTQRRDQMKSFINISSLTDFSSPFTTVSQR